jgi:hypothetical protein
MLVFRLVSWILLLTAVQAFSGMSIVILLIR